MNLLRNLIWHTHTMMLVKTVLVYKHFTRGTVCKLMWALLVHVTEMQITNHSPVCGTLKGLVRKGVNNLVLACHSLYVLFPIYLLPVFFTVLTIDSISLRSCRVLFRECGEKPDCEEMGFWTFLQCPQAVHGKTQRRQRSGRSGRWDEGEVRD